MNDPARPTAMHHVPLAVAVDGDGDRLHAAAAKRRAVARRVVEVHAPEAVRAVVAVARARRLE
jgi:hypothetical protein